MAIYSLFKTLAFKIDPETAHDLSIKVFERSPGIAKLLPRVKTDKRYQLSDGHQTWGFPVGLAAGFDKNARAFEFLSNLGFGAVELGTITPKPQAGNPRPRISRFPLEQSLLNSMGFPNDGLEEILKRIELISSKRTPKPNTSNANNQVSPSCAIGANLGKNKTSDLAKTPEDYAYLYQRLCGVSDYLVINISSPNTPGLRSLQTKDSFKAICEAVDEKRKANTKPLYLKIAPEIEPEDLRDLVELSKLYGLSGIIATNTSVSHKRGKGGLSGAAISEEARNTRKLVLDMTREIKNFSVIGAGGISEFRQLEEFWRSGGRFAQIYTSFIYSGPSILKEFQSGIDALLAKSGASTLQEWIDGLD